MTETNPTKNSEPKESLLVNLALNIIIPTIILTKFSGEDDLGPRLSIIAALAFPIAYGLMDFVKRKKVNFFSALGVFSVVLTGGISLLELPPKYIAIKEAAIPGLLGLATLISTYTRFPLVRVFLYNDKILATERISEELEQRGNTAIFDRTLVIASYIVAASFFLSSFLNYMLAKIVVVSQPGTEAFATELGKMTAYSYVVIVIPSTAVLIFAMYYLFRKITRLTGLTLEEAFIDAKEK